MSKHKSGLSVSPDKDETQENPRVSRRALQEKWDREAQQTVNELNHYESMEQIEAVGDAGENSKRAEEDFETYGWEMRGEDDYVSDPTGEADMPTRATDHYDDEAQDKLKKQQDITVDED